MSRDQSRVQSQVQSREQSRRGSEELYAGQEVERVTPEGEVDDDGVIEEFANRLKQNRCKRLLDKRQIVSDANIVVSKRGARPLNYQTKVQSEVKKIFPHAGRDMLTRTSFEAPYYPGPTLKSIKTGPSATDLVNKIYPALQGVFQGQRDAQERIEQQDILAKAQIASLAMAQDASEELTRKPKPLKPEFPEAQIPKENLGPKDSQEKNAWVKDSPKKKSVAFTEETEEQQDSEEPTSELPSVSKESSAQAIPNTSASTAASATESTAPAAARSSAPATSSDLGLIDSKSSIPLMELTAVERARAEGIGVGPYPKLPFLNIETVHQLNYLNSILPPGFKIMKDSRNLPDPSSIPINHKQVEIVETILILLNEKMVAQKVELDKLTGSGEFSHKKPQVNDQTDSKDKKVESEEGNEEKKEQEEEVMNTGIKEDVEENDEILESRRQRRMREAKVKLSKEKPPAWRVTPKQPAVQQTIQAQVRSCCLFNGYVWTAPTEGHIVIRDGKTGEQLAKITTPSAVWSLCAVEDYVWAGTKSGAVLVYDGWTHNLIKRESYQQSKEHKGIVLKIVANEKGTAVFTAGQDGSIFQWAPSAAGKYSVVQTFEGHEGPIHDMLVLGSALWSCSDDQTIRVWSSETGELKATLEQHDGAVTALLLNKKQVWSAGEDGNICVWTAHANPTCVKIVAIDAASRINWLAAMGPQVWASGVDPRIITYNSTSGAVQKSLANLPRSTDYLKVETMTTKVIWTTSATEGKINIWKHEHVSHVDWEEQAAKKGHMVQQLQEKVTFLQDQLREKDTEIAEAAENFTLERSQYSKVIDDLVLQLANSYVGKKSDATEITRLKNELDAALLQNLTVKQDCSNNVDEISKLEQHISMLVNKVNSQEQHMERVLEDQQARFKRAELGRLQAQDQLKESQTLCTQAQNTVESLKRDMSMLEFNYEAQQKDIANFVVQRNELNKEIKALQTSLAHEVSARKSIQQRWDEYVAEFDAKETSLILLNNKRKQKIEGLQRNNIESNTSVHNLRQNNQQLTSERDTSERENQRLSLELAELRDTFQGFSAEARLQHNQLCSEYQSLEKRNEELQDGYDSVVCQLGVISREMRSLDSDILRFKNIRPRLSDFSFRNRKELVWEDELSGDTVKPDIELRNIRAKLKDIITQCLSQPQKMHIGAAVNDPLRVAKRLRPLSASSYYRIVALKQAQRREKDLGPNLTTSGRTSKVRKSIASAGRSKIFPADSDAERSHPRGTSSSQTHRARDVNSRQPTAPVRANLATTARTKTSPSIC